MADVNYGIDMAAAIGADAVYALAFNTALDQISLAQDYYDLYAYQRDFYYSIFQNSGEAVLNSEVYLVGFYVPDYLGSTTASSLYWYHQFLSGLQGGIGGYAGRHNDMFSAPHISSNYYAFDIAEVDDDWNSYMFRYEEHKRDFLNERRWAQQMDSLSYGVKEAAQVERGLATNFADFDKATGELNGFLNTNANSLSTYTAYNKAMDSYWNLIAKPQQSNFVEASY